MPQYKRVGHDFTMEMDNPNSEFWELVTDEEAPSESTEAHVPADPEESE